MNAATLIATLTGVFGVLTGFLGGSARYASRIAVLENQFQTINANIVTLTGKVEALALRLSPTYTNR